MTETYERELDRVRKARADFEASQDEVERRKQDYFTAVRTLHESGMPLREIATALGLSHQRVHQMVEEATGKKPSALRRKLAQKGVVALLLVVAAAGLAVAQGDLIGSPEPEAIRVTMAPSPTEPRDEMIEFSCAQKIFEWHEAAIEAFGKSAKVVMEPMCEVTKFGPQEGRGEGKLEAKLQRRLHDILITIEERA